MNIFVSNPCPRRSARFLDDKRVVKMVLETAQLLSGALNILSDTQVAPYKTTHQNHPCAIWCRQSKENWMWLYEHGIALGVEYTRRYGKSHKSAEVIRSLLHLVQTVSFPSSGLQPFVDCTDVKLPGDVCNNYRVYLHAKWRCDNRRPTWYKKPGPSA